MNQFTGPTICETPEAMRAKEDENPNPVHMEQNIYGSFSLEERDKTPENWGDSKYIWVLEDMERLWSITGEVFDEKIDKLMYALDIFEEKNIIQSTIEDNISDPVLKLQLFDQLDSIDNVSEEPELSPEKKEQNIHTIEKVFFSKGSLKEYAHLEGSSIEESEISEQMEILESPEVQEDLVYILWKVNLDITDITDFENCINQPDDRKQEINEAFNSAFSQAMGEMLDGKQNITSQTILDIRTESLSKNPFEKLLSYYKLKDAVGTGEGKVWVKQGKLYLKAKQKEQEKNAENTEYYQDVQNQLRVSQASWNEKKVTQLQEEINNIGDQWVGWDIFASSKADKMWQITA